MSQEKYDLIQDLQQRGLVQQMTAEEELHQHLVNGMQVVYCGFDPTADSLHIGSLVPLLALKRFQLAGHKPVVLVGGATGLIGDPSFKADERKLNSAEVVKGWVEKLKCQMSQFVDFDCGEHSAVLVNNLDWISNVDVLTFLRDVGKHFSVNAMIQKESVKQRITREGTGISFTEFTYMILQSYDFVELNKRYGCTVQLGGSDQWGNITGGIELTRRMNRNQVYGLTLPLVTKADGTKFGKTESGTIWLDAQKTSPYVFYQFWINTADADVYRFLRYFTFLDHEQITVVEEEDEKSSGTRSAQAILAKEMTRIVHGEEGVQSAMRITDALFSGAFTELAKSDLAQLAMDGMPTTKVMGASKPLVELLVDSGLALTPRGEVTIGQARKLIQANAISVNGNKVTDIEANITASSGLHHKYQILKRGKKIFHLLEWQ